MAPFDLPKGLDSWDPSRLLENLKSRVLESKMLERPKRILNWLGRLFTESKDKGLQASFMGPLVGTLYLIGSVMGKSEKGSLSADSGKPAEGPTPEASNEPSTETLPANAEEQLDLLRQQLSPLHKPDSLSAPYETETKIVKGKEVTITYCSRTAVRNFEAFGFKAFFKAADALRILRKNPVASFSGIPLGNASEVRAFYEKYQYCQRIKGTPLEIERTLNQVNAPYADVIVTSKTSRYGHRAMAFRYEGDNWFIFDPYRNAGHSPKPIPFKEYPGQIVFVVPVQNPEPKQAPINVAQTPQIDPPEKMELASD